MFRHVWLALVVLVLTAGSVLASSPNRWFHVRVIESGEDGEKVLINLPLPLVESILPAIQNGHLKNGKIDFHLDASDQIDLRAVRDALRQAEDGEYVTVDGADEHVRIRKEGDCLKIHAEEPDEKVDVRVRLAVLDALLSGEPNQLDLAAGLRVLAQEENGELVRVDGEDESVRIWIDSNSAAE